MTQTHDVTERLVRRLDSLEGQFARLERERLRGLQGDIAGLKRAVERLVAAKGSGEGQPDWIGCRDPRVARDLLLGVDEWVEGHARPLGADLMECWRWHPSAVAFLLAAQRHHAAVMAGDRESDVTDYLIRVIPAIGQRAKVAANRCNDRQHADGEAHYEYHLDRLPDLAIWWATDRSGLSPGLTPWEDRVA